MDSKFFLVLVVLLGTQACLSFGQISERFIVSIVNYDTNNGFCRATVITENHVLTTASCVTNPLVGRLGVRVEISDDFSSGSSRVPAERVFLHPNYKLGTNDEYNVAVVLIAGQFNSTIVPSRRLGSITNGTAYNLFGWGASPDVPRRMPIYVFGPQQCNTTAQVYCSPVNSITDTVCSADHGSPIVGISSGTVDGFLLTSNACVNTTLKFHSVGQYRAWIDEVSGAEISKKLSIVVILSSVLVLIKNFV